MFRDITPLLAAPDAFALTVDELAAPFADEPIDKVIGIEARGFVFAAPVAYRRGAGFVPVRKVGKLPWQVEQEEYVLEYGTDLLEIHRDAVHRGERVLIVDDVIATGGTAAAAARIVERLGGVVVGLAFLLELVELGGRSQLVDRRVHAGLRSECHVVAGGTPRNARPGRTTVDRALSRTEARRRRGVDRACVRRCARCAPRPDATVGRSVHRAPTRRRDDSGRPRARRRHARRCPLARRGRGHIVDARES